MTTKEVTEEDYLRKTSDYRSANIDADYTIIPVIKKSTIDPGEVVEIEMFLSGNGMVDSNRLTISHSHEDMLDLESDYYEGEHPGYIQTSVKSYRIDGREGEFPLLGTDAIQQMPIAPPMSFVGLASGFFIPHLDYLDSGGETLPILCGEITNVTESMGPVAPILLRFMTSKEVPPGNHTTDIVFSYKNDDEVKHDQQSVVIHVRNRYERNQFKLALLGLFFPAAIVTASLTNSILFTIILPTIGAGLIWVSSYYTNIFEHILP